MDCQEWTRFFLRHNTHTVYFIDGIRKGRQSEIVPMHKISRFCSFLSFKVVLVLSDTEAVFHPFRS